MRSWKENRERNGNRERKEKFWFLKFFFLCMASILLTGCNRDVRMSHDMKDVEQRDYATILLITQGEEDDYHFVIGMAQEKVVGKEYGGGSKRVGCKEFRRACKGVWKCERKGFVLGTFKSDTA